MHYSLLGYPRQLGDSVFYAVCLAICPLIFLALQLIIYKGYTPVCYVCKDARRRPSKMCGRYNISIHCIVGIYIYMQCIRVARYYRYTGVPRYLGVPVRYRDIYEYKYSTAVCGHHTVFFLI